MKITVENQAILRRLQERQPNYTVSDWQKFYNQQENYRNNVCEFPYEFGGGESRTRFLQTTAENDPSDPNYQSLPRIGTASSGTRSNLNRNQSYNSMGRGVSANHSMPVIRQAENLDENRIVLYKRSKQLGQGYYIVEISSNNTHLFIAAYDVESPESLLIELPEKRAQEIL